MKTLSLPATIIAMLGLACSLLQAEDPPAAPAAPAEIKLFADEAWYQERPEAEQGFAGVLHQMPRKKEVGFGRVNPYRLNMKEATREVYVGGQPDLLAPYVGQRVSLHGKAVDMEVEGQVHAEIWPARLTVLVAAEGGMQPVTETAPAPTAERQLRILGCAPHSGSAREAKPATHVVRSPEELVKLVGEDTAQGLPALLKVDAIDFDKHLLLHVHGGQRPSGGWSVKIGPVTVDAEGKSAAAHWTLRGPAGPATAVLTYPGEVVLIERFDGSIDFEFVERTGAGD